MRIQFLFFLVFSLLLPSFMLRASEPISPHAKSAVHRVNAPALLVPNEAPNFDFDDNLVSTPARIRIWNKTTGKECDISTADWALIRQKVNVEGFWKSFELKDPQSLVEFTDKYPLDKSVTQVIDRDGEKALGLGFPAFRDALSDPATRARTTIISAEFHTRSDFYKGLKVLKDRGFIPALPPEENLYIVGGPDFPAALKGSSLAENKAKVMEKLLGELDAAGENKSFYFFDDDYGNITTALSALSKGKSAGQWPKVKIFLCFTGRNNPTQDPHALVLEKDGSVRPAAPGEATLMPRIEHLPSRAERLQHLIELEKSCS